MKVLIIGDCHLKGWMFQRAEELMKEYGIEILVFLGDVIDDWKKAYCLEAYISTLDTTIDFFSRHPNSVYIIGNHDIAYHWQMRESGYSPIAGRTVIEKFEKLKKVLPENNQPSFIRRLDNCIFCHGGLTSSFVYNIIKNYNLPVSAYNDIDTLIDIINNMDAGELWSDDSPLWNRPQYENKHMYKEDESDFLQVVGHTPVPNVYQERNILSCDVFSTERDGITPIGAEEFVILDTVSCKWECVK